ncbi:Gfo/Idh/MocA family protein [Tropicimonas sediminicola]|uniref:Predicted dehydrogenase n=1 Tax=Tropicimonas sediminicola TaxID=1031541 RepID=A0A239EQH5_9RHOB|nr:Gfo/Idh/MocA family oxidoreductase [Tropicimonas sediminicola]SNS46273.1 Predicted dehydrogenase [Tropicimonas sediminicola]
MHIAMIGVGMVARTHADAIAATSGRLSLRGVLSARQERAEAFAASVTETLGAAPKVYADLAELAADDGVDFVLVCTPPDARIEIMKTLAAAGKPILLEKPLERDSAAALQVVEICEAAGVPLGVVFQHRMRESSQKAAEIVESGVLGPIALVETTIPWWRPQSYYDEPGRGTYARDGGGVMMTQGIHTMNLMLSLTGPVTTVQAMTRTTGMHKMEAEDFVTAGLEFASGAVGSLVASTASYPGGAESIVLHGRDGSLRLTSRQIVLDWQDGRQEVIDTGTNGGSGGGANPMAFTHGWHQAVIEDFAEALAAGRPPKVTGREALDVHRLIDAVVESSRQKRALRLEDLA